MPARVSTRMLATHDKVQAEIIGPWAAKVKGKYTDRYRVFGVEAAEQK